MLDHKWAHLELARAVSRGDLPAVTELLGAGADPNIRDAGGYPPIAIAAVKGSPQLVQLLLAAGADPLLPDRLMGASPLHKAAQGGVVEVARLLVLAGAFLDAQAPTHGYTPLIDAVWFKRRAMVDYLLEAGANPEVRGHDGTFPLGLAKHDGLDDIVAVIERHEARRRARDSAPLRTAALRGDVTAVTGALRSGADVNERALDGHTPLQDASREGHTAVVRALLDAGADGRILDHLMKATPAHKAGYMGHAAVAAELVKRAPLDLDAQGPYNGFTALHDAVWHGHAETARVFLDAGARTDLVSLAGRTPAQLAREYGYAELAELIESYPPRPGDEA
jgi:ankyrin repeat protein